MNFEAKIKTMYGNEGVRWFGALQSRIAFLSKKWGLRDLTPAQELSYNYVMKGFKGDQPVVLKMGFDQDLISQEVKALKTMAPAGAVRVLEDEDGAFLMEALVPGTRLQETFPHDDLKGIQITANFLKKLHGLPFNENDFLPLENVLSVLDQDWDAPFLKEARALKNGLLESTHKRCLLHGDLHHENMLKHGNAYKMIDPHRGLVGDPCYDLVPYLRNPIPDLLGHPQAKAMTQKRVQKFANLLDLDEKRILDWCFVGAVLCTVWMLEDNLNPDYFMRLTHFYRGF